MLKRMIVQASLWYPECDKEADICYPMRGVMVLFPVRVRKKQMENQPAKTCTLKCIVPVHLITRGYEAMHRFEAASSANSVRKIQVNYLHSNHDVFCDSTLLCNVVPRSSTAT